MNIIDVKKSIENKTIDNNTIIFVCSDSYFIPDQYIKAIATIKHKNIEVCDEPARNIFNMSDDVIVYCKNDSFNNIIISENTYYTCRELSKSDREKYRECIVDVPKLHKDDIEGFAYGYSAGVDRDFLLALVQSCNYDAYSVQNELNKFSSFDKNVRNELTSKFIKDGVFSHLSDLTEFSLSDALIDCDVKLVRSAYVHRYEYNTTGVSTCMLLLSKLKKIIACMELPEDVTEKQYGVSIKQRTFFTKKYGIKYEHFKKCYMDILNWYDEFIKHNITDENLLDLIIISMIGVE